MSTAQRVTGRGTPHRPRFVTTDAVMRHLSVSRDTVLRWIHAGVLPASSVTTRHYADDRPRKTTRHQWRIAVDDFEAFLVKWRSGMGGLAPGRSRRSAAP